MDSKADSIAEVKNNAILKQVKDEYHEIRQ